MALSTHLAIAYLMATVLGQSSGASLAATEDKLKIDDGRFQNWFHTNTVKCGTRPFDQSYDYDYNDDSRSIQRDTSDGSVFAKSFLDKIVGGNVTRHGEIPWQARVWPSRYTKPSKYDCGAVIINEFWLLSAAHCFYGRLSWRRRVTVGEHHLYREDPGQQEFEVDRIFKHEMYSKPQNDYDIALIRIKPSSSGRGIQFNDYVQPVCLPDSTTSLLEGTKLTVSGWGWTMPVKSCKDCAIEPQDYSDVLMKADIPLIGQDKCKRLHRMLRVNITDRMFCAGYTDQGIDSCLGDSGGPVVYKTRGYYGLYGIVSWGAGCAQRNKPGVYARVPVLVPWIEDTIKTNSLTWLQGVIPAKPE